MQRLAAASRGTKWNCPGREWMSTSSVALSAGRRRKSRNSVLKTLPGAIAVACLVLGSGWTVYTRIVAASVYPTIGDAEHVETFVRRPTLAARSSAEAV